MLTVNSDSGAVMSIVFSCPCGKKLQAPDEFAGRKMKCKACAKVLLIPNRRPVSASAKTAGKSTKPAAAKPQPRAVAKSPAPVPAKKPVRPTAKPTMSLPAHKGAPLKPVPPPPQSPAPPNPAPQPPRAEPNLWADRSLEQRSVPWQFGDEHVENAII